MTIESYLQKFGLSEKESLLYLAGLQLGPANLQELVNASKLKRSTVYDVMSNLKELGLFKLISKGKSRQYIAAEPSALFSILKQKENLLQNIFGQLEALQNSKSSKPSIRIYKGLEGVKEIYEDILKNRSEHIEILSSKQPDKKIVDYWLRDYTPRRIKKGSFVKVIAPESAFILDLQKKDKYSLRETRIAPKNQLPFQNEVFAYNNKIAFITQEGDNSLGLVVESQDIFNTFSLLLNFVWQHLPSAKKNFDQ